MGLLPSTPVNPVTDIINALTGSIGSVATGHATTTELQSNGTLSPGALSFYNTHSSADSATKPKAFINWVLFDEQFNIVSSNSGFEQVGADNTLTMHTRNNLPVDKNGYLYIYVSNETPNIEVFFDNLQVTHIMGAELEETHYYPFGLTMSGISSKALAFGQPENKRKFNAGSELQNKEFSDGGGLEVYDTHFRQLDPQLGRWWQIDPKPDYAQSLYSSRGNNPILRNDPLGDTTKFGKSRDGTFNINGQNVKGKALAQKLVDEWATIGGVKLKIKNNGEIKFKGFAKGENYSKTGRAEIMKMVTGNGQVGIEFNSKFGSQTDGNTITINPNQITDIVNGTSSDMDPVLQGWECQLYMNIITQQPEEDLNTQMY